MDLLKRAGVGPVGRDSDQGDEGISKFTLPKTYSKRCNPKKIGRLPILEMNSSEPTNWNFHVASSMLVSGGQYK